MGLIGGLMDPILGLIGGLIPGKPTLFAGGPLFGNGGGGYVCWGYIGSLLNFYLIIIHTVSLTLDFQNNFARR